MPAFDITDPGRKPPTPPTFGPGGSVNAIARARAGLRDPQLIDHAVQGAAGRGAYAGGNLSGPVERPPQYAPAAQGAQPEAAYGMGAINRAAEGDSLGSLGVASLGQPPIGQGGQAGGFNGLTSIPKQPSATGMGDTSLLGGPESWALGGSAQDKFLGMRMRMKQDDLKANG